MNKEELRECPHYKGIKVNCDGSIVIGKSGAIRKPYLARKSYFYIGGFPLHRLVADAWCDGYFDGAQVDHIDTNKENNHYTNLRWVTAKENMNNTLTLKHLCERPTKTPWNKGKHGLQESPMKGKPANNKGKHLVIVDGKRRYIE